MTPPIRELRADCERCCGLCCTGPAFDASQGFGCDKPAHQACRHLRADDRCAIHPVREEWGFPACAGFDCHGAGQWVTQQVFGGGSWRDSALRAAAMFEAYRRFRVLHELLAAIDLVPDLALKARVEAACELEQVEPGRQDLAALRREVLPRLQMQIGTIRSKIDPSTGEGS